VALGESTYHDRHTGVRPKPTDAELIKFACDRAYKDRQPCNEYVQAVGSRLPFPLPKVEVPNELADGIIETLRRNWRALDAEEAMSAADKGAFVLVGLHSSRMMPNIGRVDSTKMRNPQLKPSPRTIGNYEIEGPAQPPREGSEVYRAHDARLDFQMDWSPPHGHVAIVVAGRRCYSTNAHDGLAGKSKGEGLSRAFKAADYAHLEFFTPRSK
jgi:hypothetical protein